MASFIEVKQLAKVYGSQSIGKKSAGKQVLTDINLSIEQGESVALVGASGSGKSTLCRLLLGIEPASSGDICWHGVPMRQFGQGDWTDFRQEVQLVFQDSIAAVNPRQRIGQILSEPLRYLRKLDKKQIADETERLLKQVGLPEDCIQRRAGQLSGGQLQRVGIARALAAKPRMIALDESLSGLDLVMQQQVISLLKSIQADSGTAFLLVTHDLRLVDLFCQRVIVLDSGRIVENRKTGSDQPWKSDMGRTLAQAILPALPHSLTGLTSRTEQSTSVPAASEQAADKQAECA